MGLNVEIGMGGMQCRAKRSDGDWVYWRDVDVDSRGKRKGWHRGSKSFGERGSVNVYGTQSAVFAVRISRETRRLVFFH